MLFVCPKCKGKLNITDAGGAVCEAGHTYDRSRKGYYNFLLTNKGGTHGDNKLMVDSRRAFLDADFYKPLAVMTSKLACEFAPTEAVVLDVGCGEGYYTDYVERALRERDGVSRVSGFDISKDAAARAARRNPNLSVSVASAYAMPVADGSVDLALNLFSPLALTEIKRTLKTGGFFLMTVPGERHLFGLKELLYKNPYLNSVKEPTLDGFELVTERPLSYKLTLDRGEDIRNLFYMTPYAYRTPKESCELVEQLARLETSIEFITFVYKKR